MKMTEAIRTAIALGTQRAEEHDAALRALAKKFGREHPAGFSLKELWDNREAPRPAHAALRRFLRSLPIDQVTKLQALMYSGRDGEDLVPIWQHWNRSNADDLEAQESAVRSMLEKVPLHRYLALGVDNAKRAKIDLDGDWEP